MSNKEAFVVEIQEKYTHKGDYINLGVGMLYKTPISSAKVNIPLKTMNRHGLIAGATGTGKTKTLQLISEQLSLKGVPTLLMDIKGDLSGLAAAGTANEHTAKRHEFIGEPYTPMAFPVELMSISDEKGVRLRSTVLEFGPILFSKIIGLNDTQESIISIIFKYCEDKNLPLVDLQDMRKVLLYVTENEQGKKELNDAYGNIASSSLGTIVRNIVALEQQGADKFFGEPSFEVDDLLKVNDGKGTINIIRLTDIQSKPHLFSTFMLSLMAEIYANFPEQGDADKPKLIIFIDEAHLVFNQASKALLDQIETMVKLIRSKGVGLYFVTQVPDDIPEGVLGQLGLKIQHALRGFTAKDRKSIQKAVENYPLTDYYKADELITELGIGEAFVTGLNEKGIPTPLVHTYLQAPKSRMDILSDEEINQVVSDSNLADKYNVAVDKESAYEILNKKMNQAQSMAAETTGEEVQERPLAKKEKEEDSFLESLSKNTMVRQVGRTFAREVFRGLLGILKKK